MSAITSRFDCSNEWSSRRAETINRCAPLITVLTPKVNCKGESAYLILVHDEWRARRNGQCDPGRKRATDRNTANNRSEAGCGFNTVCFVLLTGLLFVGLAPAAWSSTPSRVAHAPSAQQPTSVLILRGLDKVTGQSAEIIAPVGTWVRFATLKSLPAIAIRRRRPIFPRRWPFFRSTM